MRIEHAGIGRLNADGDISLLLLNCRLQIGIRHLHEAELLAGQGAANDVHLAGIIFSILNGSRPLKPGISPRLGASYPGMASWPTHHTNTRSER